MKRFRKGRETRVRQVACAVIELYETRGRVTMRMVANRVGLVPSAHVLSLLEDATIIGMIDTHKGKNSRGIDTFYYTPNRERG